MQRVSYNKYSRQQVCETALDVCSKHVPSNLPGAVVLHKTTKMKVASLLKKKCEDNYQIGCVQYSEQSVVSY
jgi:hypothetical protein